MPDDGLGPLCVRGYFRHLVAAFSNPCFVGHASQIRNRANITLTKPTCTYATLATPAPAAALGKEKDSSRRQLASLIGRTYMLLRSNCDFKNARPAPVSIGRMCFVSPLAGSSPPPSQFSSVSMEVPYTSKKFSNFHTCLSHSILDSISVVIVGDIGSRPYNPQMYSYAPLPVPARSELDSRHPAVTGTQAHRPPLASATPTLHIHGRIFRTCREQPAQACGGPEQ